jgi:hypothetical protein
LSHLAILSIVLPKKLAKIGNLDYQHLRIKSSHNIAQKIASFSQGKWLKIPKIAIRTKNVETRKVENLTATMLIIQEPNV